MAQNQFHSGQLTLQQESAQNPEVCRDGTCGVSEVEVTTTPNAGMYRKCSEYSCFHSARVAKPADAKDLKSFSRQRECGFDSHPGHQQVFSIQQLQLFRVACFDFAAADARATSCPGRQVCVHVGSEHGIDSGLVTLLFSKPFEEVCIEADRYSSLCRWYDDARLFPEFRIGWACLRLAFDGAPDLTIAQGTKTLPVATLFNQRLSSTLLFHAVLPSKPI